MACRAPSASPLAMAARPSARIRAALSRAAGTWASRSTSSWPCSRAAGRRSASSIRFLSAYDIRARGKIHRSVLMSRFIDEVEKTLSTELTPAELTEVRREGQSADLGRLAAEEAARLSQ